MKFFQSKGTAVRLHLATGAMVFSLLGAVNAARADVTYDYVGNPFTSADRPLWGTSLNVSVTFDSTVTSSFTGDIGPADIVSITPSFVNGDFPFIRMPSQYDVTDFTFSNGRINYWNIQVYDIEYETYFVTTEHANNSGVITDQDYIYGGGYGGGAFNGNVGSPGVWTVAPGSAPEPVTWVLMLVGLGGVGAALRRRRVIAYSAAGTSGAPAA